MRIIGGSLRGRRLTAPADARVRPTGDRVREAWMSILGQALIDAQVLDLYAGSGALGLEALSRGAAWASFVELNPRSLAALERNIATLAVNDRTTVHRADALRYVERLPLIAYDIALADPPYSGDHAVRVVAAFRQHPFARILSVEHRSGLDLDGDDTRRYGDTAITFCHAP